MSDLGDWGWWIVAGAVTGLFLWFFVSAATRLFGGLRRLVDLIQNWPQYRRAMTAAEAKAGGRYPLWLRATRVALVVAMIGLMAFVLWRRFGGSPT